MNLKFRILLFVFNLLFIKVFSQENIENSNLNYNQLFTYTTTLNGESDLLVNGNRYMQAFGMAHGSPFFETSNIKKSIVYIKGECFDNADIKYDIFQNQLVLLDYYKRQLVLNPQQVDSFALGENVFVSIHIFDSLKVSSEIYFEKINNGKSKLLKSYKKKFIDNYSDSHPYGTFSKQTFQLFLQKENHLTKINSIKDLYSFFPQGKKEIGSFMKENQIQFKKATHDQLQLLMNFCNANFN